MQQLGHRDVQVPESGSLGEQGGRLVLIDETQF